MKKVPYSPLIPLVESHVAVYKIYVLKNPLFNDEIFYVGQTLKNLEERLYQHIQQTGTNRDKIKYIRAIIDAGSRPVIESVEVMRGTCFIDKMLVNERELYWIKYYKAIGCKLLNSSGMSNGAKCHEYHGYLSSLKRGETSWHYYYCGKTAGGYEVYDKAKMDADGFRFPEPIEPPKTNTCAYSPWENNRFLSKLGEPLIRKPEPEFVKTEIFPEQPGWSLEFASGITWDSIFDEFDDFKDDCDEEIDDWGFEQGEDAEPEETDNDEWIENSLQPEIHFMMDWETHLMDLFWGLQLNGCTPNFIEDGIPEIGYRGHKKYKL
jgi:hypothetical protein